MIILGIVIDQLPYLCGIHGSVVDCSFVMQHSRIQLRGRVASTGLGWYTILTY